MKHTKTIALTLGILTLGGCGGRSIYLETTPGSPLPSGVSVCRERDTIGRCSRWSPASETCINPKGVDVDPPTVPCASVRK